MSSRHCDPAREASSTMSSWFVTVELTATVPALQVVCACLLHSILYATTISHHVFAKTVRRLSCEVRNYIRVFRAHGALPPSPVCDTRWRPGPERPWLPPATPGLPSRGH